MSTNMVEDLKNKAFAAAKLARVVWTASELSLKLQLLSGNGNYFSDEVLKPFVDALFTGDRAAIDSAKNFLTEQARNIMATQQNEDRGIVLFGGLSEYNQRIYTQHANAYVAHIEKVVKEYVAKVPGTGAAIAQG